MKNGLRFIALVGLAGVGIYIIYKGTSSSVKEATPEAKFNRNITIINNG